jgi:hypothetical protein
VQTGVQPLMPKKTSYFDQTCNEFIWDRVDMACLGPKPIKVLFKDLSFRMELINHKNAETYAITQRTSSKVTF